MHYIAVIFILLFATPAFGANVTFEWDCLEGCDVPDLAGFRLYEKTDGGEYVHGVNFVQTAEAADRTLVRVVPDGHEYSWVLTAIDTSGNESGYSNEVMENIGRKPGKAIISIRIKVNLNDKKICKR